MLLAHGLAKNRPNQQMQIHGMMLLALGLA